MGVAQDAVKKRLEDQAAKAKVQAAQDGWIQEAITAMNTDTPAVRAVAAVVSDPTANPPIIGVPGVAAVAKVDAWPAAADSESKIFLRHVTSGMTNDASKRHHIDALSHVAIEVLDGAYNFGNPKPSSVPREFALSVITRSIASKANAPDRDRESKRLVDWVLGEVADMILNEPIPVIASETQSANLEKALAAHKVRHPLLQAVFDLKDVDETRFNKFLDDPETWLAEMLQAFHTMVSGPLANKLAPSLLSDLHRGIQQIQEIVDHFALAPSYNPPEGTSQLLGRVHDLAFDTFTEATVIQQTNLRNLSTYCAKENWVTQFTLAKSMAAHPKTVYIWPLAWETYNAYS